MKDWFVLVGAMVFYIILAALVALASGCTLSEPSHNYNPQPSFIWADPLMWSPGQIILER